MVVYSCLINSFRSASDPRVRLPWSTAAYETGAELAAAVGPTCLFFLAPACRALDLRVALAWRGTRGIS